MKKLSYIALAGLLLTAACNKDELEPKTTIGLVYEHFSADTKLHIDNLTPGWDNGDSLQVND